MDDIVTNTRLILARELQKLSEEIEKYPSGDDLWLTTPGIANSAGNLCLHLCGNLQHFIGHVLGGTGYVRNRPGEFSRKGLSKEMLLVELAATSKAVDSTLSALPPGIQDKPFPDTMFPGQGNTGSVLMHLVLHFGYHSGQINYHRRMISSV
jgi:hypothetical protein